MNKLSPSKEAEKMGREYLRHEFRKIFNDIKDEDVWKKIDRSVESFLRREGEESFWNLLFGISEGWKIKYIAHILSDKKYRWKLEDFPLNKIVLTGMSPLIDKYVIKKCERDPLLFRKEWRKSSAMRKEIRKSGFSRHKERDGDPVLIFQKDGEFRVFDGMRRTLLAATRGEDKIKAWIGYEKNKKGKPLISVSRCLFLADILSLSRKNKDLQQAVLKISKEIAKNYRNGRKTIIKRIANWSHDPDIKKTLEKI